MARVILETPGEDVIVGGRFNGFGDDTDTTVIGTASGGEVIDVRSPADVVLDASFNQGGDTIRLPGEADEYTARLEGSRVILESVVNQVRISIPVGPNANTIIFGGDDSRQIRIVDGQVLIGDEVVDSSANFLDSVDETQLSNALFALQAAEENLQEFLDNNNVDSVEEAEQNADDCDDELAAARAMRTDSQLVADVNSEQADVEAARQDQIDAQQDIDDVPGLRQAIADEEAAEARRDQAIEDRDDAQDRRDQAEEDRDAAIIARDAEQDDVDAATIIRDDAQIAFDQAEMDLADAQTEFDDAQADLALEQGQVTAAEARVVEANADVQREGDDVAAAFETFEANNPPQDLILLDDNLMTIPNENNEVLIDLDGAGAGNPVPFIIRNPLTGELELDPAFAADPEAQAVLTQVQELDAAEEERQDAETDLINEQDERDLAQTRFDNAQTALTAAQADFDQAEDDLADAEADLAREEAQRDAAQDDLDQANRDLAVAEAELVLAQAELDDAEADLVDARADTDALDPGRELRDAADAADANLLQQEEELREAIDALEERRDLIEECEDERAIADEAARLEGIRDDRADDVAELGFDNVEIVDGVDGAPPLDGSMEDENATAGSDAFVFINDEDINEFFVINNFGDQGDDVLFISGVEYDLVVLGDDVEVGDDDVGDDTRLEVFVQQQDGDTVLFIEDDPFDGNANGGGFTGDIIVLTDNTASDVNLSEGGFITVDDGIFGANFA